MRWLGLSLTATVLLSPVPALAQDFPMDAGVLDMGMIGGDAAASHLQQSEERRARGMRSSSNSRSSSANRGSNAQQNCARKGEFRAQFGANDPRVQQLYKLCSMAGY